MGFKVPLIDTNQFYKLSLSLILFSLCSFPHYALFPTTCTLSHIMHSFTHYALSYIMHSLPHYALVPTLCALSYIMRSFLHFSFVTKVSLASWIENQMLSVLWTCYGRNTYMIFIFTPIKKKNLWCLSL